MINWRDYKNLKDFIKPIREYSYIFSRPINSWRIAFLSDKRASEFVIKQTFFYLLFFGTIILYDFAKAIKLLLLEIGIIMILIIPLVPAYKYWISKLDLKKDWKDFFRVALVVKYQFSPILILILLGLRKFELESLYEIIVPLAFFSNITNLCVIPFIATKGRLIKAKWIATNIFSIILWVSMIGGLASQIPKNMAPNSESILDAYLNTIAGLTPLGEINLLDLNSHLSWLTLQEDKYVVVLQHQGDSLFKVDRYQFATPVLMVRLYQNKIAETDSLLATHDSLLRIIDKSYSIRKVRVGENNKENARFLSRSNLDSLWSEFNIEFYQDKETIEKLKNTATSNSAKTYFTLLDKFYIHYDSIFHTELDGWNDDQGKNAELITWLNDSTCVVIDTLKEKQAFPELDQLNRLTMIHNEHDNVWNISTVFLMLISFGSFILLSNNDNF